MESPTEVSLTTESSSLTSSPLPSPPTQPLEAEKENVFKNIHCINMYTNYINTPALIEKEEESNPQDLPVSDAPYQLELDLQVSDSSEEEEDEPQQDVVQDPHPQAPDSDDLENVLNSDPDHEQLSSSPLTLSDSDFKKVFQFFQRDLQYGGDFPGFCLQDHDHMIPFLNTKSEVAFRIFMGLKKAKCMKEVIRRGGVVPIPNPVIPNASLVYTRIFQQNQQKLRRQRALKKERKTPSQSSSSPTPPPPSSRTSTPISSSSRRLIQTPKRYLEGLPEDVLELELQKRKKRQFVNQLPLNKTNKDLYQIGLLPPKYPKLVECSSTSGTLTGDSSSSSSPSNPSGKRKYQKKALPGFFEISNLHQSGELERTVMKYQVDQLQKLIIEDAIRQQLLDERRADLEQKERQKLEKRLLKQEMEKKRLLKNPKKAEITKNGVIFTPKPLNPIYKVYNGPPSPKQRVREAPAPPPSPTKTPNRVCIRCGDMSYSAEIPDNDLRSYACLDCVTLPVATTASTKSPATPKPQKAYKKNPKKMSPPPPPPSPVTPVTIEPSSSPPPKIFLSKLLQSAFEIKARKHPTLHIPPPPDAQLASQQHNASFPQIPILKKLQKKSKVLPRPPPRSANHEPPETHQNRVDVTVKSPIQKPRPPLLLPLPLLLPKPGLGPLPAPVSPIMENTSKKPQQQGQQRQVISYGNELLIIMQKEAAKQQRKHKQLIKIKKVVNTKNKYIPVNE